ncbi:hypothetical protein FY036_20490 [Mesorhizobium microcysteis]|uniref:UrcA family protein n=1 Tax=Neoaquamicrobium microcysteis TaxID=2682781 RepID=A0A5D4GN34_9HYPH|nr:hypothetical protein [Mesorhizobium microcysteis]TYR30261.1 hypothetical protein FY036_20490 [Mesorhizobium microcysteis]
MRNKLLTAVAFSFALSTGAAFAQASGEQPVIHDPAAMLTPFHTDDTMTTLRTAEENQEHFLSLDVAEQQALREQCQTNVASEVMGDDAAVDEQTTASIDENGMPSTMADLCAQVETW